MSTRPLKQMPPPPSDRIRTAGERILRLVRSSDPSASREFSSFKRRADTLSVSFVELPDLPASAYDVQAKLAAVDTVLGYARMVKRLGPRDTGIFMRGEDQTEMDRQFVEAIKDLSPDLIYMLYPKLDRITDQTHSIAVYRAVEDLLAPYHEIVAAGSRR